MRRRASRIEYPLSRLQGAAEQSVIECLSWAVTGSYLIEYERQFSL